MKVLITGDRGFVGEATKRALGAAPPEVRGFGDPDVEVHGFDLMDGYDVRDRPQFAEVVRRFKPDRILHLAAIARFNECDDNPIRAFETNALGTQNVVKVAELNHIPLVYASTGSVYMPIAEGLSPPITESFPARGNSVYGCSKYLGDLYVRLSSSPWIVLRYAHLYGNEKRMSGLVGNFLSRVERGLAPVLYGGRQSSDFTYIDDIARANVLALTASGERWNQVYNIGTGQELTVSEAADMLCDVFDYDGPLPTGPQRGVDAEWFVYDTAKAEQLLGFKAEFSFRQGLEAMRATR